MADVAAVFGTFLTIGIIFPGFLTAVWLLFPGTVELARLRIERTPWQTFWMGGVITILAALPIIVLLALPNGAIKFVGAAALAIALTFASLGAAGIALRMSDRLQTATRRQMSPAAGFVRGAVALELAVALPIIGWFIVLPLSIVVAMGASTFAVLRWLPKAQQIAAEHAPATPQAQS